MVVSIPVSHPEAPPRPNMVRGFYESIEMIREIPVGDEESEENPVEWMMVTRSDPGGGIPRFMVERSVPSSIVQDAVKFLDWACARNEEAEESAIADEDGTAENHDARLLSITETNGVMAGIGERKFERRLSQRPEDNQEREGILDTLKDTAAAYIPEAVNPLQRKYSSSSVSTSSSVDSFASAEQFRTADRGFPMSDEIPTPSTMSLQSVQVAANDVPQSQEMDKIESRKRQLEEKLEQAREKETEAFLQQAQRSQKETERAAERHKRERQKQEEKFQKEIRKLEERREKEEKKLLARQQKEADKNHLTKAQRERDEFKQRVQILESENKLLKEQIGQLQKENTALVAGVGKMEGGSDMLKLVMGDKASRARASSRASGGSGQSGKKSKESTSTKEISDSSSGILGINRSATEPVG
jgi:flagellar biosynthesis GTPase FlhF